MFETEYIKRNHNDRFIKNEFHIKDKESYIIYTTKWQAKTLKKLFRKTLIV